MTTHGPVISSPSRMSVHSANPGMSSVPGFGIVPGALNGCWHGLFSLARRSARAPELYHASPYPFEQSIDRWRDRIAENVEIPRELQPVGFGVGKNSRPDPARQVKERSNELGDLAVLRHKAMLDEPVVAQRPARAGRTRRGRADALPESPELRLVPNERDGEDRRQGLVFDEGARSPARSRPRRAPGKTRASAVSRVTRVAVRRPRRRKVERTPLRVTVERPIRRRGEDESRRLSGRPDPVSAEPARCPVERCRRRIRPAIPARYGEQRRGG